MKQVPPPAVSSRHCHSPRRGCALVRRGSIDQASRLTRSSAVRHEAVHRSGIHDAAIPVPADNFAVIRRRSGSSPEYPRDLLFPGPDRRKMAGRPACPIGEGPYANNVAGRASWSTNPSAGRHSGGFGARQRRPRQTSGHHQKASLVRRLNKIWVFDRTLMHQNNSGSWGRR